MHVYGSIAQLSGRTRKHIHQVTTVMPVNPYLLVLLGNCQAVVPELHPLTPAYIYSRAALQRANRI